MCGICGVVNLSQAPVEEIVLAGMTERISHRGPDARGMARPQPWVGLGHTRLKVIDLSDAAAQPMTNEARTVWVIFNGEIYNFQELRAELEGLGHRFRSRSDTEVIVQAYEQWGAEAIPRLDGMFAIAIWDDARRQLLLVRDRTGKKPLFYYQAADCVAFASEVKALLANPQLSCEPDFDKLPLYLAYGYVPCPDTFYHRVQHVPPATLLVLDATTGRVQSRAYWRVSFDTRRPVPSHREAAARLRELLTAAVQKRLVADVPVGIFLSGGVDSTIIAGLASRLTSSVKSFTIGFEGDPQFDERHYARVAAQAFGTQHTEFVVEPQAIDLIDALVYHHDQPFGDSSAIPTYVLAKLTKSHVTVALNGDGGDELFAGYPRFMAGVLAEQLPALCKMPLAACAQLGSGRAFSLLARVGRFARAAQRPFVERYFYWNAYFSDSLALVNPEWRDGLTPAKIRASFEQDVQEAASWSVLSRLLYVNFKEYLLNDLHIKMDRCTMAHGLEARSPLLDTAVIDYVCGLPDAMKLSWGRTKVLLREACADVLPPAIQRRGKWGFGVPIGTWFRGNLKPYIQEMLLSSGARWRRFLDAPIVEATVRAHWEHQRDTSHQLWVLLTFEVWLRLLERNVFHVAEAARSFAPSIQAQQQVTSYGRAV